MGAPQRRRIDLFTGASRGRAPRGSSGLGSRGAHRGTAQREGFRRLRRELNERASRGTRFIQREERPECKTIPCKVKVVVDGVTRSRNAYTHTISIRVRVPSPYHVTAE